MSKTIVIDYEKSTEKLFEKIKTLVKNQNGYINGNHLQGKFEVSSIIGVFKGEYHIKNKTISIKIDKKPFIISTKTIDKEIQKYLSNN